MSKIYLRQLVESGVHFGHRVSRWNPKMAPYIYGKRNLIHIINLVETVRGLARGVEFLKKLCATGQQVVFVGTKRQIKNIVKSEAERCGMPYVVERWLGGSLTNFQTIRARLKRLEQLEELDSTGQLAMYSKKIQASLMRELRRIKKNLEGIREMHRLPGCLVVVDPKHENIAVKEANKLGIPVIAILDTDCDPEEVDIPIPGNDDAIRSVQILLERLTDAVNEGKANFDERAAMEARAEDEEEAFELASEKRRAMQRRGGRRRPGGGRPDRGGPGRSGARPGPSAPREPAPAAVPPEEGAKPAGPEAAAPAAGAEAPPPALETASADEKPAGGAESAPSQEATAPEPAPPPESSAPAGMPEPAPGGEEAPEKDEG